MVGCKIEDTKPLLEAQCFPEMLREQVFQILSMPTGLPIPNSPGHPPGPGGSAALCCPILSLGSLCDSQISIIDEGPFCLMDVD